MYRLCAHVEKLSKNFLKNDTENEKEEPLKPVVDIDNSEKIKTFIEKFDQMKVKQILIFFFVY